ncbi:xanthine dehydrogenase family protein molybdopterin-binding subunit [Cystobacter ferrugineus]|uniref:Xanthine dehydrogenase n=1 Tax=Cystobacter ferrugineus TaxID=83449 RepID=A0A1L9BJH2_9BACT|nr:xanthine dehydrogenase family protein molybdopterin-binding subunit [Cystobacter ferrugineus]OJH42442.1 xanthine dehydrogenase [Cystobacter ferrugineus]
MMGKGISRTDGPLKVTGGAKYSYERRDSGEPVVGHIVGAAIGRGRITRLDTSGAERAPGVLLVMTHRNTPEQGRLDNDNPVSFTRARPVLSSDRVDYFGEPVAFVVARTLEQARAAAGLIHIEYAVEEGAYELASHQDRAYAPKTANIGLETRTALGDFERAFADAPVKLDQSYTTPHMFSMPMEPCATVARWDGEDLVLHASLQALAYSRTSIANTLGIPEERIHIDSAFVGGGFGTKLYVHCDSILAALAARQLGLPVKVALSRRQMFSLVGHRPESIQRVRLAAERDGRLTGLAHEVNMQSTSREEYCEQTATVTRSLYAAPNRFTNHRVTPLDLPVGEAVRGPGELPGLMAVESAMDELAHLLDMDPIELRIRNEPELDPERNVPLTGRRLVECMRVGAERFGWSRRPMRPGTLRDGRFLVGYGMAAAIRMHFQGPTRAIVRMERDGGVIVKSDMTDIGTGTYTILSQFVSESLDVPLERIQVMLARSDLPRSSGSGGSWGAANTSVALHRACEALKQKIARTGAPASSGAELAAVVAAHFPDGVEADGAIVGQWDDPNFTKFSAHTYGATFAEVGVDIDTGEVRLRRMLGVFAAGRILNPKLARSQLIGGMSWGVSAALHEAGYVDVRFGHFVNGDLGEYYVPVHADIPALDAVMLDDLDKDANPLGIKGVGELGICGSGAAVVNAVFNATGVRVRDFPITLDKLFPGLPTP